MTWPYVNSLYRTILIFASTSAGTHGGMGSDDESVVGASASSTSLVLERIGKELMIGSCELFPFIL